MTTTSHSSASRRPRSSPIAILRPGDEPTKRRSSLVVDSDDDDDFLEGGGVGALSLGTYVGSVPTKPRGIRRRPNNNNSDLSKSLPGAPMLASRSFEMRQGSLPPISLAENIDSSNGDELPSYGSLRESHLEGKFLDGPSSYRDHSGQIHALRHNQPVRMDDSATSYHAPATLTGLLPPQNSTKVDGMADWSRLTPGERLMASSSENNKTTTTTTTTTTSTLSSMMMQGNLPPQAKTTTTMRHDTTTLGDADADDGMLSTSLTGLEILQSARGRQLLSTAPASMPSFLPNDGGGIPPPPPVTIEQPDDDDEEDLFELDME